MLEVFGSPFARSINVVVALLFGYLVAAVSDKDGMDYAVSSKIDAGQICHDIIVHSTGIIYEKILSHHPIISCPIVSCHAMPCHAVSCHLMSSDIMAFLV